MKILRLRRRMLSGMFSSFALLCLKMKNSGIGNNEDILFERLYTFADAPDEEEAKIEKTFKRDIQYVKYLTNPRNVKDEPVILLVPHYLSQKQNKSMCFSFLVTFIEGLYIASAIECDDKIGSPVRKKPNYIVKEMSYRNGENDSAPSKSGSSNMIIMKTISIAPQNHFKKIKKRVYARNLDMSNTSWVYGFNSCLKYELFNAKIITSHEPKEYYESTLKEAKWLQKRRKEPSPKETCEETKTEELSFYKNPQAMDLYKKLKEKNANVAKMRDNYADYVSNKSSKISIFDQEIKSESSVSDEDEKEDNQIMIIDESLEAPEKKKRHRARDAPYRLIVIPGWLYDLYSLTLVKEIK